MSSLADAEDAFHRLSDAEKKRFIVETSRAPEGTGKIIIWAIVLVIMAGVIFFGYLGFLRLAAEEDGAVLFAFATTALGAIAWAAGS